ncbi:hypothetical protein C8R43DRAFT_1121809 [Mycena crocata]|nr:hypothetical protein C8R43DRAFT_1121809 [Mycena crocata]
MNENDGIVLRHHNDTSRKEVGQRRVSTVQPTRYPPRILDEGVAVSSSFRHVFKRKATNKTNTDHPSVHNSETQQAITFWAVFSAEEPKKKLLSIRKDSMIRLHTWYDYLDRSIVPRPDTGSSTSQVATGSRNFAEIQNPTENGVQHADTEPKSEPPEPTAGTVKDSILPNLSAVLDVVQQVGKILESVPYIEPIGAILSAGVKVYKEVEDNSGEQDALLKKVNTLNQHLEKARSGLEKIDQAEAGNDDVGLASDVNAYMDKLKDVKQLLTQSAERGWIKRTIQRGAIATELDSLKQNLSLFSDMFSGKLNKMARQVVKILEFITETERKEIIEWLSPINFFTRQADIFRLRQPGTGKWILAVEEFKRWETGSGGILWGRGIPGAGKTVVASVVVDYLTKNAVNSNIGVACIYLNHKETDLQTPANLLAAVWRQLVMGKPIVTGSKVQELFRAHSEKRTRPELAEIHQIPRRQSAYPARLSHPAGPERLPNVDLASQRLPPKINAETLEIRAHDDDIQPYVKEQINNSHDLDLVVESSVFRNEIIAKIVGNVDGMFLLAKLHVDSVKECPTVHEIRKVLENLSGNLDKAYDTAIERIEKRPERTKRITYSVLTWVANVQRPLSVAELREALAVEWGAKKDRRPRIELVLSICAGLVYLDGRFPDAHTEIARTLFTYMALDEIQILLCHSEDLIDSEVQDVGTQHALLPYCYYCFVHAVGKPEDELRDMILDFISRAVEWNRFHDLQWTVPDVWNRLDWPTYASPLWVAAAANLYKTVRYMLDCGTSPNGMIIQLDNGSALCAASKYGHIPIVKLLLERGADIHAGDEAALQEAALRGKLEVVRLLLENGADIHAGDDAAVQGAVSWGQLEVVRLLLEKGADIHAGDDAALQIAAEWGQLGFVRFLLENGADIHAGDEAALQGAARTGELEVVRLLLENGADIHAGHDAAVQEAAQAGELEVVRFLLENGAEIYVEDKHAF